MVEWIVGVLMLAIADRFDHAVADCESSGVEGGQGGCCGEGPLGFVFRVPSHCLVGVSVVEPRGYPCIGWWWKAGRGVGVVACYEV